ncbi:unnamed protein product [Phytophthora fragariaefolia]|uniref:Unnamed protein product n=1 Tax=Phytophthora fragariaefolia TaxID=1490495 RepID=A0A9W7CY59_9STRA|nr:unnamed protein product [Phytophthora fragariaefolia]
MLQHERFWDRYRVAKVTIKMLYAVDFASRPRHHFLYSEDPATYHQDRTVLHDDGQWGGPEPAPRFQIRRAVRLHPVIWAIQDAASEWYPSYVVAVLRAVHTHATYEVPGTAPHQEIHAMCNMYQAVFRQLFEDILHGISSRDLEGRAHHMLSHDSPEYIRFVTRVLSDVVRRALLRLPGRDTANPRAQRQAPPRGRPPAHSDPRDSTSAVVGDTCSDSESDST